MIALAFCNSDSFVRLFDGAERFHGKASERIDILVNSAGIAGPNEPVIDYDKSHYRFWNLITILNKKNS